MKPALQTAGAVLSMAALTDPGRTRDHNEDSVHADPALGLAVVADGLGGHNAGEVASATVTEVLARQVRRRLLAVAGEHIDAVDLEPSTLDMIMRSALVDAHAEVIAAARTSASRGGMASTAVAILVHGGSATIGWVGDSTAFLWRRGKLSAPLTASHNLGTELGTPRGRVQKGTRRSLLTRVVGGSESLFSPDTLGMPVHSGDLFLLCSDGLTDMLDAADIAACLGGLHSDLAAIAQRLVHAANRAGGEDNISVVLVRVEAAPAALPATPRPLSASMPGTPAVASARVRRLPWLAAGFAGALVLGIVPAYLAGELAAEREMRARPTPIAKAATPAGAASAAAPASTAPVPDAPPTRVATAPAASAWAASPSPRAASVPKRSPAPAMARTRSTTEPPPARSDATRLANAVPKNPAAETKEPPPPAPSVPRPPRGPAARQQNTSSASAPATAAERYALPDTDQRQRGSP